MTHTMAAVELTYVIFALHADTQEHANWFVKCQSTD